MKRKPSGGNLKVHSQRQRLHLWERKARLFIFQATTEENSIPPCRHVDCGRVTIHKSAPALIRILLQAGQTLLERWKWQVQGAPAVPGLWRWERSLVAAPPRVLFCLRRVLRVRGLVRSIAAACTSGIYPWLRGLGWEGSWRDEPAEHLQGDREVRHLGSW